MPVPPGYVFALLAMFSIGMLGVLSKLADAYGCRPLHTSVVLFGSSAVLMSAVTVGGQGQSLVPPAAVWGTGLVFGTVAILAFWIFLYGLQFGKITSSWLFMNMSAIVPATLSVVLYHERVTAAKAAVLVLVVVSILLLWYDKQRDSSGKAAEPRTHNKVWMTAMLSTFFLSGIASFGLRVLASWGLAAQYTAVYLVYWYLAGFIVALIGFVPRRERLATANVLIALVMAVASVGGQYFIGLALSRGVPGTVVYMLATGASLCVVVLGGVVFFREHVGSYAKWGLATGLLSALLLGLG
jgi:drug/metabolite transporter (DMT)-like permease